jgi:hypothetical protein
MRLKRREFIVRFCYSVCASRMGPGKPGVGSLPMWMASRIREALRQDHPCATVARAN